MNISFEEWFDRVSGVPEHKIRKSFTPETNENSVEEFNPGDVEPPEWEKDRVEVIRQQDN